MKIENLIQLLDNRLREFKLSRDYARMNGDLERMNAADKEVITLEDTLFKLNLLVDTSKSAAVKDAILAEVIMDGSVAVLGEYDITPYATDPKHEEKIMNILSKMGVMDTVEKIDDYIKDKYLSSPVTGEMIMSAASAYNVDARLTMAIMEQDSSFGTAGVAVRTLNPGNVGNDDSGNTRTYESWQEGVTAVAEWLNRYRMSKIISEIPDTAASMPVTASSSEETLPVTTLTTTTTTASASFQPSPEATAGTAPQAASPSFPPTTPATAPATPNQDSSGSSGTGQAASSSFPFSPTTPATAPATASSSEETIPVTTSTTTTTTIASSSFPTLEPIPVSSEQPTSTTTTTTASSSSSFPFSPTASTSEETTPLTTSTTTTTTVSSSEETATATDD